ncbi:hypothetical protein VNO80_16555 [Phaseolus coccineus]|uniref:CAP N-terminal domain-containing protein n=1 Tax=Phaseolus coccineus TaxID=3886 RepID=A0AAN9MMK3_PHACN
MNCIILVSRLESLSAGFHPSASSASVVNASDATLDPSIVAFTDLIDTSLGFPALRRLLVDRKGGGFVFPGKPDLAGFGDFLKPLNEVITKATNLTKGRRSYFFNHLKVAANSLSALAWIA